MKSLPHIPNPNDSVLSSANLAKVRSRKEIELSSLVEAQVALAEIALVLAWIERNFHTFDCIPKCVSEC